MRGQKGEGAKQNQAKGASGAAEQGPLFPRLHVNETEKAGPKAPPRNKMALYEQFTVPSHRFLQPSQKPAPTMYQQQYGIRELGYPYVPYYIPSGPNHGVPMYAQPSHNTSSSGVISSGAVNQESRYNAPRQQKAGKSSPCRISRHLTEATADCSVKSLPAQKDKVAIVPAESSLTNQVEESTTSLQNASSDMEGPHITDITESLQEALSTVEIETECMGHDVRSCEFPKGRVLVDSARGTCLTNEDKLKQAAQLSIFETLTQPAKEGPSGPSYKATVHSCLQTESLGDECKANCVTEAMASHVHCTTQLGTLIELKGVEERPTINAHCQSSFSSENQANLGQQSASTSGESLENNVDKIAMKSFTIDVGKADNKAGEFPRLSTATSQELKRIQKRSSEVSQTSQCETRKEGHSDDSVVPSTSLDMEWSIKPKDVIRAVGQQQFWKARKRLLRQQRIFSDQVFQLHKLIKIQQLLAETPGTLIDEEMHFETREDFDAMITSAKRATSSSEDANKVTSIINEGSQYKSSEAEDQANKKWGQTPADGKVGLGSNAYRPESNSVGGSAWGYPSLGPWVSPMGAQGGPFNYPPFAGAFPSGPAFGLPMGHSFPGSIMSFGIPYYDRRQEPPAEVDSNYGPPTAFKHERAGTGSVNSNHVSNGLAASWYFAQLNHVNNHQLPAGGCNKDVPTGSGASVNKSSATPQAVKASCFPGLSYQWGLNCQAGQLNTDGLENSAHQSEHSSPSKASRLNCHTSSTPSRPLAKPLGLGHQDVEGRMQNLDPASSHRINSLNQYDSRKKSVEKEKLSSHSKDQAVCLSADCLLSDGNDIQSDVNPSPLELFPLVPSLSSSGGRRLVKAGEEGQGGVIRAVPRRAIAASKSAAGILLSLQRERQK